ncbi:MAG: putative Ig domain-containing protein [Verrucomicrobia bacterium]|nr:putative Ig domain-containing protein [Verrucomicrobiota bacterium]
MAPSLVLKLGFICVLALLSRLQASAAAPEVQFIADKTVSEQTPLSFTVVATDTDVPAQQLTFSLASGEQTGATLSSTSGLFSWTPTEAQGPSTNLFTVIVADNGAPSLTATQRFNVVVLDVNRAPEVSPIANQTINEGTLLVVSALATDPDIPVQTLSFALSASSPTNAAISAGGLITWQTDELIGPGTNRFDVIVTDNGVPSLSTTQTFFVVVNELNISPTMADIPAKSVNEGELLTFTITATDPDRPAQTLTFSLGTSAPEGASVNPVTGVFTWTPSEFQGPGSYFISAFVTDSGSPAQLDAKGFIVTVNEVNRRPEIQPVESQVVNEGQFLGFSVFVSDADVPVQNLTLALGTNAPAGAVLSPGGFFSWTPTAAQGPATYTFNVTATDDGTPSLSATQTVTIVVSEPNLLPILEPISDRTVREDELFTFPIVATDPNGSSQTLTYSIGAGAPDGATIDPVTGVFSWTPAEAQGPGSFQIGIIVTDNGTPPLSAARSFLVTVNEANRAPILAPLADQEINVGGLLVFSVPAEDPDIPHQTLLFALGDGAPQGASVSPGGLFTWTATSAQLFTTNRVAIIVSDGSLSVTQAFTAIVLEPNQSPSLAAISDQTISEGETISFPASATDPNGPSQTLTFSLGAGAPEGATIDPVSGVFSWTPSEAQGPGSFQIGIIVTDDGTPALGAARSFLVTVNEVNQPPVLQPLADQIVNVGGFLVFSIPVEDPDIPHPTLNYSLGAGAPAGAAVSDGGLFTWTPTAAQQFTTNRIAVIVSDGSLSVTQSFTGIVLEPNQSPSLATISDQTVTEGESISFPVSATDPNGPSQTLTFSLGAGAPAGAILHPTTGEFEWTPSESQGPGSFQIGVIVTDNGTPPLAAARSFLVTVNEVNQPPTIAPLADQTINVGGLLVFSVPADDADIPHPNLIFSLGTNSPAGAEIGSSGLFTWTPTVAQLLTTNRISVIVSDGSLSATQTFTAIVLEPNQSPTLATISDQTISEGELLSFPASATDPNGSSQTLTFSLGAGAPEGATIDPVTGAFSWTPNETQGPGNFQIGIVVTDNGTPPLGAARSFLVTVEEVNQPPIITPLANQTVNVGGLLVFSVTATDVDIPRQSVIYSLGTNSPAGAIISPAGLFTWTPTAEQANTTNIVSVIAMDDGFPARSSTNEFQVIVTRGDLSRPALANPTLAGGTFTVALQGVSGRTYFLERTASLDQPEWVVVDEIVGSGSTLVLTDLNPTGGTSYYRARVQ